MALIKCPECEQEVSDLSPCCIHCGYPLNEEELAKEQTQPKKLFGQKNPLTKKKKIYAISGLIIILLVAYLGLFHLGGDNKYAYDLIVDNVYDFNNPTSVRIVSGCAGFSQENGSYAFVCLKAKNAYGADRIGYYSINEEYGISDLEGGLYSDEVIDEFHLDNSLYLKMCRNNKLNIWKINLRLWLYWTFH